MITPQFEKEWKDFSSSVDGSVGFEEGGRIKVESIYRITTKSAFVNLKWSNLPEPGKGAKTIAKTEFWCVLRNNTFELKVLQRDLLARMATAFKPKCKTNNEAVDNNYIIISTDCKLVEKLSQMLIELLIIMPQKDFHIQTQLVGEDNFLVLTTNYLLVNAIDLSDIYKNTKLLAARIDDFS